MVCYHLLGCCRLLQLGGMSLSDFCAVEDNYLQFKWPLNKVHNGNLRVHPDWSSRLVAPVNMLLHISQYCDKSRHKQGLSRLGINTGPGQSNASDHDEALEFDCEDEEA